MLAGSALAFSSFAIGVPAAFADAESRQGVTAAQTDAVAGPSLVVDRAELSVDDFVGSADEVDGVVHTVEGAERGSTVSYVVTGPAGVSDFSWTAPVNADGIAEFSVYAPGMGTLAALLVTTKLSSLLMMQRAKKLSDQLISPWLEKLVRILRMSQRMSRRGSYG